MALSMRIGLGYDAHRLVEGIPLVVGGVEIPHPKGGQSHTDGDVLTHALMDALLGAAQLGDLGVQFPPEDPIYKDVESLALLKQVLMLLGKSKLRPIQIDAVIMAQAPKMRPHIDKITENLQKFMPGCRISVKATTTDGLGFVGREEGIAAQVVAMLKEL